MNRSILVVSVLAIGMSHCLLGALVVFLCMIGSEGIANRYPLTTDFWYRVLNFPFGWLINILLTLSLFAGVCFAHRYLGRGWLAIAVSAIAGFVLYLVILVLGSFFVGYPWELAMYAGFYGYLFATNCFWWRRLLPQATPTPQTIP